MSSEELGSIGSTGFDHAGGAAWASQSAGGRSRGQAEAGRPQDDQVELSSPHELILRLLRERILEHTRINLRLDKPQIRFVVGPLAPMDIYVGRIISDQNLCASTRRGDWTEERIAAAIEDGMASGLEETLQVLYELDQLTEESWNKIRGFMAEFHRKIDAVRPDQPPSP